MKNFLELSLLLLLFLSINSSVLHAQFTVEDADESGVLLSDGYVFVTNSYDIQLPSTTFDFRIKNTSDNPIKVRIYLGEFTNANGDAELCLNGVCTSFLIENDYYPQLNESPLIIQPGQFQLLADGCKFGTKAEGVDPTLPSDYHLKFYQVDDNEQEIGSPINITYRYMPNNSASIDDVESENILIYPNPANNFIYISNLNKINIQSYEIYSSDGRIVKTGNITSNTEVINIENIEKGMCFIVLKSEDTSIITKKIVIKF